MENIKNNPHMSTEAKVIFDMSSFLLSNGEIKKRKNNPLKANTLLAPVRNTLLAPVANIGRERSILSKSITKMTVNNMLNKAIGTIIVFAFMIDFFPIIFAVTPINKNNKTIKAIG